MNNKIESYVHVLFSDIPHSIKANQLKEELLSNMSVDFENYIKNGKTEKQAYSLTIKNLDNIEEMFADVMPSDDFIKQANYFRNRKAKNIAISIAMYIIGVAFLIGLGGFGLFSGNLGIYGLTGLIVLLIISAIATGIIIYTNMSIPLEYKNYKKKTKREAQKIDSKHIRLLNNILTIYWIIITVIYLVISFITGLWIITWIIMVVASAFHFILKTIFENKYDE